MPNCPNCNDSGFADAFAAISLELRAIKTLIENQKNATPTMMNDARRSSEQNTRAAVHPLRQRAVSLCTEIDWLFKKSGNGGYDYKTANESAYRFLVRLKQQGNAQVRLDEFLDWLDRDARPLKGSLRVTSNMFDFLESLFQEHRPRKQA